MPIYAVFSVSNNKIEKEAFYLEKFGFFAKITIKNVMRALALDFTKNSKASNDKVYEVTEKMDKEDIVLITKLVTNKRILLVTDGEYNANIRFKALMEAIDPNCDYNYLVKDYKDWTNKDLTSQIEKEMQIANDNVIRGLSAVLDRGQTLSDLVDKSEHLSSQTKLLFKEAKKQNSCC